MDEMLWWSPLEGFAVVDAMTADAKSRARALAPDDGAWWWMTHSDPRDADAREMQIARLRSGLDLLVLDAQS
ncbi:MAG TPA: hypothetical protein VG755_11365 [Nannocystaceae bacterium]|nr:hypothetical protein [Nannocystaceae bacterium]